MTTRSTRQASMAAMAVLALPALAHDGHGLGGSHWHATDAWGFAGLALALVVAFWLTRGGGK